MKKASSVLEARGRQASSEGVRGKFTKRFQKPVKVTIHSTQGDEVFEVTKVGNSAFQWKRVPTGKPAKLTKK